MQTETEPRLPNTDPAQTKNAESLPDSEKVQTNEEISLQAPKKAKKDSKAAQPSFFVRGVDMETRQAIKKAAKKLDKTQGEFFNAEIRAFCTNLLKRTPEPAPELPAAPLDIEQMIDAKMTTMGATIASQVMEQLATMQKAAPAEDKRGFLARLLGK